MSGNLKHFSIVLACFLSLCVGSLSAQTIKGTVKDNSGEPIIGATVMEQGRYRKVIVYKYKRKTGYHKKNGHRQAYTQVKIEKINA